ncbi:MAG: extracellular solute-binding protein [Chloroflexi bacterium]|nr:extracellular solute-binding protein [Chloroflexota bacterium]
MNARDKVTRRQLLRAAATVAVGTLATACAPATPRPAAETQPPAQPAETTAAQQAAAQPGGKFAPRGTGAWGGGTLVPFPKRYTDMEITVGFAAFEVTSPVESDTFEDNIRLRWIKENTGVWYKRIGGGNDALTAAMAANDLPDCITHVSGGIVIDQLIRGGALEDITDIWESTASALTKKAKKEGHSYWNTVTRDGRIYGVPQCPDTAGPGVWYIRQDWLDKLKLQPPTTLDEYAEVAQAFKKEGLATWGIAAYQDLVSWIAGMDEVFGAHGVMPSYWLKDDTGKLAFGATLPGNVQALETLRKWYADGVLPKDMPTANYDTVRGNMMGNKVGIWQLYYWGPEWMLDLYRAFPEAKLLIGEAPAGPEGKRGHRSENSGNQMVAWKKGVDRAKVEAMINSMNWQFERKENAVENADYSFLGANHDPIEFEGYDYVWDGDQIKQGPTTTLHWGSPHEHPMPFNPTVTRDAYARMDKILAKKSEDRNPFERYIAEGYAAQSRMAHKSLTDHPEWMMHDESDGIIPGPNLQKYQADLTKLWQERFIKIVVGDLPLTDFDSFVAEFYNRGGQQVTDEVNEWYAKNSK